MYSYSSNSMSLYGNRRSTSIHREVVSQTPTVINSGECVIPITTSPVTTTPPPIDRVCKSPFVTPNHPLYMFGDSHADKRPSEVEPSRPQKATNSLESMNQMSLSSPISGERHSPFRRLHLSRTFDDGERQFLSERCETPHRNTTQPPEQNRVIRKTTAFGMERMRELSIYSPLQQKLFVIEGDLEGEDGLARRLRRMKRRLFLENVANKPQQHLEQTPKHSNRVNDILMEGMEMVLQEDDDNDGTSTDKDENNGFYLTLSASSPTSSLRMEIEPDDQLDSAEDDAAAWLRATPQKELTSDSSVITQDTVACSTFGNDDSANWVSLPSISEQE